MRPGVALLLLGATFPLLYVAGAVARHEGASAVVLGVVGLLCLLLLFRRTGG